MRPLFLVLISVFLLGAIFYGGVFARTTHGVVADIERAFALPVLFVRGAFMNIDIARQLSTLALENQSLRAELLARTLNAGALPAKLLPAKVYAVYPLNDKSLLTITAGAAAGVAEGRAVLAAKGVFLGQVTKTGDDWSEVRTVFDPGHNMPVRIGQDGIAGLLRGGSSVAVTLITKDKQIVAGDAVYTASRDLPYGLLIGTIGEIRENPGAAFREAGVLLPYTLSDVASVFVMAK